MKEVIVRQVFQMKYMATPLVFRLIFTVLFACMGPLLPGPMDACADPAFLAPGPPPNLLIIVDNSESMLDLAYMPDTGACHDSPIDIAETEPGASSGYDRATTYAGYFSANGWYAYNPAHAYFESIPMPSACAGTDGFAYTHVRGGIEELCLQRHNGSIYFKARGNLLNWATASRFDIQKKVLTGGKFNHQNRTLISQGRGCPGTRFIRQIRVWDTAAGTAHVLALGIRAMDPDQDQTTAVEVYAPLQSGFDNSACQSIFDSLPSPATDLDALNDLMTTCTENRALPFELPRAADPTMHMPLSLIHI